MICPSCYNTGRCQQYGLFIDEGDDLKLLCVFTDHFEIALEQVFLWPAKISALKVGSVECACGRKAA